MNSRPVDLGVGESMPFRGVPAVGITTVAGKPVTVIDWFVLGSYYDRKKKWHFAGYAFIVAEYGGRKVKVKVKSLHMIQDLKVARAAPFETVIRKVRGEFKFIPPPPFLSLEGPLVVSAADDAKEP